MEFLKIFFFLGFLSTRIEAACDTKLGLDELDESIEVCNRDQAYQKQLEIKITDGNLQEYMKVCSSLKDVIKTCVANYTICYPDFVIR